MSIALSQAQIEAINNQKNLPYLAALALADQNPPREIFQVTFTLTTAADRNNPQIVNFPFKSFRILSASDSNANINFIPNSKSTDQGDGGNYKLNGVFNSNNPIARGFFWWAAQSGKSVTVEFYRDSSSVPGNFSTSVSQVYGALTTQASPTACTTTAAVLLATDNDRKSSLIQNQDSSSFWVGASNVTDDTGANPGIEVAPGQIYLHDSTDPLYWISKVTVSKVAVNVYK